MHRHGSPYDRGSADSYYRRPYDPHYYEHDTYQSKRIGLEWMSVEEVVEYTKGYNDNEKSNNYKEWE